MKKLIPNDRLFSESFTPVELEEALKVAPQTLWQHKKSEEENFYLHYLVVNKKVEMLAKVKPQHDFGISVSCNTTASQNLIHLASIHANTQEMFDVLKPLLDQVLNENLNLLYAKNRLDEHPLSLAVHHGNIYMVRYLLERFAVSNGKSFRAMFKLPAQDNPEITQLLNFYGVHFYAHNYSVITKEDLKNELKNRPNPARVYQNEEYWRALLSECVRQKDAITVGEQAIVNRFLRTLNEGDPKILETRTILDRQLGNLGVILQNETDFFEDLQERHLNNFIHIYLRQPVKRVSEMDLANTSFEIRYMLEALAFASYFAGFVFWCMYNDRLYSERASMVKELQNNPIYENCMYVHIKDPYTDEVELREVLLTPHCDLMPSYFSGRCAEDPFITKYTQCHDLAVICAFQTVALLFTGIMLFLFPKYDAPAHDHFNARISWKLDLPQKIIKSPLYLARYLMGELKPLTSLPHKNERVEVYKELLNIFLEIYPVGELSVSLNAQLELLNNKPMDQLEQADLMSVLTALSDVLSDHVLAFAQGSDGVDGARLAVVLQRLTSLSELGDRDLERASVGSPLRLSRTSASSRHSVNHAQGEASSLVKSRPSTSYGSVG